jgi:hypothetical protein
MKHMLAKGKYSYASTVADVTELYTLKSDPVKAFTDRYTDASEYHTSVQEMYDGYVRWSKHKDLKILTAQRLTRRLKNLGFVESRPYDDYGSRIYAWVNVSFTESFDKEIPAEIKAEQKKLDGKYTKTDKKILYWQQLGEILDNLSEKTKDPNHAQISPNEQEIVQLTAQLKNDGFSIAGHSRATLPVHKKSLPKESWEKNECTQGNSGCVRANNFKVFLDRKKLQTNYPRFLSSLSKNPRIKSDLKLDQISELPKNQSFSVSTEKTNSVQNNKDLVHLKMDLRTTKRSYEMQHGGIPDINTFIDDFFKRGNNGYLQLFSREDIVFEAEKICKTIPQQSKSSVVSTEECLRILKEEGY